MGFSNCVANNWERQQHNCRIATCYVFCSSNHPFESPPPERLLCPTPLCLAIFCNRHLSSVTPDPNECGSIMYFCPKGSGQRSPVTTGYFTTPVLLPDTAAARRVR